MIFSCISKVFKQEGHLAVAEACWHEKLCEIISGLWPQPKHWVDNICFQQHRIWLVPQSPDNNFVVLSYLDWDNLVNVTPNAFHAMLEQSNSGIFILVHQYLRNLGWWRSVGWRLQHYHHHRHHQPYQCYIKEHSKHRHSPWPTLLLVLWQHCRW